MLKDKVGFSAAPCFVYLQNRKIPLPPFGPLLPSGAPFLPVIGLDSFHDITPPPRPLVPAADLGSPFQER